VPDLLVLPNRNETHGADFIRGKRIVAFAGIARPEVFRETLIQLGADITHFKGFRDHHFFQESEIRALVAERQRLHAELLITTEKDYVRLAQLAPRDDYLGYLTIRFRITSGQETFFDMIRGKAKEACARS